MKKVFTTFAITVLFAILLTPAYAFNGKARSRVQPAFERAKFNVRALANLNQNPEVYVVHGIPGEDLAMDPELPVDVFVNDAICLLEGFEFGEIVGPVTLDPGDYNVKISLANESDPCTNSAVIEADLTFETGKNYSVVAHLTEMGDPTGSLFENNVYPTGRGKARIIAHHTAAAPSVDVTVERNSDPGAPRIVVQNFTNPDQVAAEVRPGGWQVSIAPAMSFTPVFGPVEVTLKPFTAYLIYAVGSLSEETFTLLVKPIYGLK
jgi:hypothetical protein